MFFCRSQYGGESPAGTPDRDAFYDDNGGVADRLVMRYELDSVRAHEVVLAGLDTKYPYAPRSSVPVAMPVAVPAGIQPFPPPSRPSTSLIPAVSPAVSPRSVRVRHAARDARGVDGAAARVDRRRSSAAPRRFHAIPGNQRLWAVSFFWLFLVIFGYSHMGNCTDGVFCLQTRPRYPPSTRKIQSHLSTHKHRSRRMAWRAWRRRWRRTS